MILRWLQAVAFLAALLPGLSPAQTAAREALPDFSWQATGAGQYHSKVRFANGDIAQTAEGELPGRTLGPNCALGRVEIRKGKTGELLDVAPACHEAISLRGAYPSARQARVAIVAANCGAGGCASSEVYAVLYLDQGTVRVAPVGWGVAEHRRTPTTFSFWFKGDRLSASVISHFYTGATNAWGDLEPATRFLHASGHYVDTRFRKDWLKFVGEHPEAVLGDTEVREPLTRKMKPEQFRAIRSALGGPGSSRMVNGRYLVMDGCKRSVCPLQFGSVVMDGISGDLQVMVFIPGEKRWIHVGTRLLVPIDDHIWLHEVQTQDVISLSVGKRGTLVVKPVATR